MDVPKGRRKIRLGSVSFNSHRDQLVTRDSVKIEIWVSTTSGLSIEASESFNHRWPSKTYVIDNTVLSLLSSLSSYDIRMNNYEGGVHPNVTNDCNITLNLMGKNVPSGNFSPDPSPYVEELLIAIPPSPVPIKQKVALYINHIVASKSPATGLFFIRDGKLGIHLEFPNSGRKEIKAGFHNWGRDNEFRDKPVGDIELGPFSVDVLLTPELRGGKVS